MSRHRMSCQHGQLNSARRRAEHRGHIAHDLDRVDLETHQIQRRMRTVPCAVGLIAPSIGEMPALSTISKSVDATTEASLRSKTLTGTLDLTRIRDRFLKGRLELRRCCGQPTNKVWRIGDVRMMHQNSAKFACTSTYLQPRTHFFWPYWKINSQMLGGAKRNKP